ncbi:MAG: DUF4105 domain-containing protein [Gemmatimonadota bacterium]|nr:MAG: DUF4105 domain-containing protein [Gemmatimonadota bacterium]
MAVSVYRSTAVLLAVWLVAASLAPAISVAQKPAVGETAAGVPELSVYLITMGPGQAVWERYGHNALWIQDNRTGVGRAYNYGIFSFRQENFFVRFVQGRPLYWMQGFEVEPHLAAYVAADRSIWIQELNLTPQQRAALRDFLEWNERPENRFYQYDPYRDNCSTRIRDAIDHVLGGRLQQLTDSEATGGTYRSHSLRLLTEALPAYLGLLTALGQPADRPLTRWEEMFVPLELQRHLRDVTVLGADGLEAPLVLSERTAFESSMSYGSDKPHSWTLGFLAIGLILAALIALPALRARPASGAPLSALIAPSVWALFAGLVGLTLAFLWALTNHWIAYWNENLFFFNPLALPLAVTLPLLARRTWWAERVSLGLAGALAALSVLGLVVQVLPWFFQANGEVIAFALPPNLALAWVAFRHGR